MAAVEEGWRRPVPPLALDREELERLLGTAVLEAELFSGGRRNTNYRLRLHGEPRPVVLRLYTTEAAACRRELALLRLVKQRVPVPSVVRAEPTADPPWALLEWIDGMRFDHMLEQATPAEVEQSSRAAGEVLAAIHAFAFPRTGFFGPNLEIVEPLGYSWLTGVDEFFGKPSVHELVGAELASAVRGVIKRHAWRLDQAWGESALVHADYKSWNLLVRRAELSWTISAVLDWEFTFAGPPLCDFGVFLRYSERMAPQFTSGFFGGYRAAGGTVPPDARNLARLIDLVSLWTFLERAPDDLAMLRDVKPLLESTVAALSR